LGQGAGSRLTTGDSNIDIGAFGFPGESATIRIGEGQTKTFIDGIRGATIGGTAIPVLIDGNGQLGTLSSARRFKKEIQPMDNTSEAILALKPVTFHYKSDNTNTPQFGLIAEEVAEVNPDLVVRDENGDIYTVRYDAVNAMLLNEFLKAHRKAQQQEATITQLKKDFRATVAQLAARLDEQATQIQKVRVQMETSKAAPQTVANNQ
jgi:trimeric autotransporter adhesin